MTNKEYLQQYKIIEGKIQQAAESLQKIIESADSISVNYSGMPRAGGITNKPEAYAIKLDEAATRRCAEIEAWRLELIEIEDAILSIENRTYSELLHRHYVRGETWDQIAAAMNYSDDHVRGWLHGTALKHIKQPDINTK